MTVGERLLFYRKKKELSLGELSRMTGIPKTNLMRYEKGVTQKIPIDVIPTLEKALALESGTLMGWTDNNKDLPKNIIPLKKIRSVPIIGRIACGEPILAEQNFEGSTLLPEGVNADFALTCQGDSMIDANIQDGDLVFIKEMPDVENGEIAAVVIGEEATLKKVYHQGNTVTLIPANSNYDPMVYQKEELNNIRICGKAVAILRHLQ